MPLSPPLPAPTEVARKLCEAFPGVFSIDEEARTLDVQADFFPLDELAGTGGPRHQAQLWWDVAFHVTEALGSADLDWTLTTNASSADFLAVGGLPLPARSQRLPPSALGWGGVPGLALCIAACEARLGRGLWRQADAS